MLVQLNLKRIFLTFLIVSAALNGLLLTSCRDTYIYDKEEPGFLGASIYDYLESDGNFTYYLRLINDLDYKDVLQKTGSKTVFPAKDEAFERFFASGVYARSYDGLTLQQKRMLLNTSMINMAYLSGMLSNTSGNGSGMGEGLAVRHATANTYMDSVPLINDPVLFQNDYWSYYKDKGIYMVDNDNVIPMVHFTPEFMQTRGMTDRDFYLIHNGKEYNAGDIYINGDRVSQKDIICKNGYIHVMEDVLLPAKNMTKIIHDDSNISIFNMLLNKFCAPYYSDEVTKKVHEFYDGSSALHPLLPNADSIFVKAYFNEETAISDPQGNTLTNYGLLYYDPTNNGYSPSFTIQDDMGAMFVPTNDAMTEYFSGPKGRFLEEAYGRWEDVPTSILAIFLKNHQKKSFVTSMPHSWTTLLDETSYAMGISESNLVKSYIGCNGVVYVTNKVFPPIDFQCVYGPTLISANTQIMNWAIQNKTMKFYLYLRSMENMYNLIVPTDDAFDSYRDPVAWAKGVSYREIWSFKYDAFNDIVFAYVYSVDGNGEKAALLRQVTDQTIIQNRLNDIVDMHIVVGEKEGDYMSGYINDGHTNYAMTKSGATLKVSGSGDNVNITGGGDIELGVAPAEVVTNSVSGLKSIYDSDNGRSYYTDKILQDPIKSVYTVLGEHEEYKAFFDLLNGDERVSEYFVNDKDVASIFDMKIVGASSGLGLVVNSFNNFRYTVFVPTKEALDAAFQNDPKLFTWDEIANQDDPVLKKEETLYLLKFLRYHFMDNSIFISGNPISNMRYETAAINDDTGKFYRLILNSDGTNLNITCEGSGKTANVIKTEGLYNLMTRDYIVNNANYNSANSIISSSRAVIHLIDNALKFE